MTRFSSIQVLRALAALGVVVFHLLPSAVIGAAGVDIFFVISGFIMGTVGVGDAPGAFLYRRIIRIVPLYWLVTLLMCLLSLVPGVFQRFSFDAPSLVLSLLFIPYTDASGHVWPLVVSGWTLDIEMFFYAVFAAGLLLRRPVAVTSVAMLVLAGLGWLLRPDSPVLQSWTSPMILEFAAGLLLARWVARVRGGLAGSALLVMGVAGLAFAGAAGLDNPRLLVWGVPGFALVAGAVVLERAGLWPRLRLLELVGDASYSLYLIHGLVIDAIRKVVHAGPGVQLVVTIGVSVAVAYGSYRLIERPAARVLRDPRLAPRLFWRMQGTAAR